MKTKKCSRCEQEKSIDLFTKHKKTPDGLRCYCRECQRQIAREAYRKNYDAHLAYAKKQRDKGTKVRDAESANASSRKWKLNNKEKVAADSMRRKLSKIQRTPEWLCNAQIAEIEGYYAYCNIFNSYKKEKLHVDHIVPLRGKQVSGLHVPWNLQVLAGRDNMRKLNAFNPSVYLQQGECAYIGVNT